jgi:hypothetical protein
MVSIELPTFVIALASRFRFEQHGKIDFEVPFMIENYAAFPI